MFFFLEKKISFVSQRAGICHISGVSAESDPGHMHDINHLQLSSFNATTHLWVIKLLRHMLTDQGFVTASEPVMDLLWSVLFFASQLWEEQKGRSRSDSKCTNPRASQTGARVSRMDGPRDVWTQESKSDSSWCIDRSLDLLKLRASPSTQRSAIYCSKHGWLCCAPEKARRHAFQSSNKNNVCIGIPKDSTIVECLNE